MWQLKQLLKVGILLDTRELVYDGLRSLNGAGLYCKFCLESCL